MAMLRKVIPAAMLLSVLFGINAQLVQAAEQAQPGEEAATDTTSESGLISLIDLAPELMYQLRRYPKFYGDDNTSHGGLWERSYLLGTPGGTRDSWVDRGVYFDASVTQALQGNSSGGLDTGSARYNGSADYWLTIDTGKAGLWSGGALFFHAESSWRAGRSVSVDTGALIPANQDATMPTPGESEGIALPEVYLVQALPGNFIIMAGKMNFAGVADTNFFANNERTQFQYTGLVNNPILGAFIPYTPLGLVGVWAPSKQHSVAAILIQSEGDATSAGFDNFDDYTAGMQYQYSRTIDERLPGNFRVIAGYSSEDLISFKIDDRHRARDVIGDIPLDRVDGNRTLILNFDQYLWTRDGGDGRMRQPPVGIGIFGRAGWAPDDRNVISQFYSFGIGGYGMLIPGRHHDQWGLGWAGTHISSDLRDAAELLGIELDAFEHAVEAFYDFRLTPAIRLSLNAQMISSPVKSTDTAYTIGMRLQVDL